MGTHRIPETEWMLSLFPFKCVFQAQVVCSHYVWASAQPNPLGASFADLWSCWTVQHSCLWHPVPWALDALVFLLLALFFLNQVWWLGSIWVSLPWTGSWTPKDVNWQLQGTLCVSSLRDFWPSLPGGQCLTKHCFIYFVLFLVISDSYYFILVRSQSFRYEAL